MALTKEEKLEIAQLAVRIIEERNKRKVSRKWLDLQREIKVYCEENSTNIRWTTLQSKIYDAIRVVLDISRIDEMTDQQTIKARKMFNFIKQERESHQ